MKIDCNITENYLTEKFNMCKEFSGCKGCPLKTDTWLEFRTCEQNEKSNIKNAIEIVQNYSNSRIK